MVMSENKRSKYLNLNIWVSPDLKQDLVRIKGREKRTLTKQVEYLLAKAVEEYWKENPE